jgi:hypothetical protein
MKRMGLVAALIVFVATTPVRASDSSSHFKDDAGLSPTSRFLPGEITSDVAIKPEADYKKVWMDGLTKRLTERKILATPGDPAAITITARVTHYEEGNAWARWGTFGAAMQTKVSLVATYTRGGQEIGTAEVNQREGGPGLNTIGAWEYIFKDAAERVVFEVEKKMGTDD